MSGFEDDELLLGSAVVGDTVVPGGPGGGVGPGVGPGPGGGGVVPQPWTQAEQCSTTKFYEKQA